MSPGHYKIQKNELKCNPVGDVSLPTTNQLVMSTTGAWVLPPAFDVINNVVLIL